MNMAKYFASLKWLRLVFGAGAICGAALGALGGFGLGLIAGTLVAPKEGKQLRDDITKKVGDVISDAKAKSEQFSRSVTEAGQRTTVEEEQMSA